MKIFDDYEKSLMDQFYYKHIGCYTKVHKNSDFDITIRATGIGDVVKIKCLCCEQVEDVTNYDNW